VTPPRTANKKGRAELGDSLGSTSVFGIVAADPGELNSRAMRRSGLRRTSRSCRSFSDV